MKVTQQQLLEGLARYIDGEFVGKLQGLRKWAVALASAPLVLEAGNMIERNRAMLASAGYLTEDGMVDLDRLFGDAMAIAQRTGSVTEHIPMVGDVTFTASDIEALRGCIAQQEGKWTQGT